MTTTKALLYVAGPIILIGGLAIFPEIPHELSHVDGGQLSVESGWPTGASRIALVLIFIVELYLTYRATIAGRMFAAIANFSFATIALLIVIYSPLVDRLTQVAKVHLFPDRYERCANSAIEYEPNKKFAICDYRLIFDTTIIIAFDSGDSLPSLPRLPGRMNNSLFLFLDRKKITVLTSCNFEASDIGRHFYLIITAC